MFNDTPTSGFKSKLIICSWLHIFVEMPSFSGNVWKLFTICTCTTNADHLCDCICSIYLSSKWTYILCWGISVRGVASHNVYSLIFGFKTWTDHSFVNEIKFFITKNPEDRYLLFFSTKPVKVGWFLYQTSYFCAKIEVYLNWNQCS